MYIYIYIYMYTYIYISSVVSRCSIIRQRTVPPLHSSTFCELCKPSRDSSFWGWGLSTRETSTAGTLKKLIGSRLFAIVDIKFEFHWGCTKMFVRTDSTVGSCAGPALPSSAADCFSFYKQPDSPSPPPTPNPQPLNPPNPPTPDPPKP